MNILVVSHKDHEAKILPGLIPLLKKDYSVVDREHLKESDYQKKDLIIVVGGDGTFLRANQLNKNIPMIGINPNPHTREGFFSKASLLDFHEKIKAVLEKRYRMLELMRLEVSINGKKLSKHVLNEVYIGDALPYNVFNYDIQINGKKEFQRSSGVLIGTAAGSTAWLKSAGGKIMELEGKKFQYVARELYEGKHTPGYNLKQGILDSNESVEITCKSPGIAVLDAIRPEYELKIGDKIKIMPSKDNLRYILIN